MHTEEKVQRAKEFDPSSVSKDDTTDLPTLAEAVDAVRAGEARVRELVARARANGRSWGEIGITLGVRGGTATSRGPRVQGAGTSHHRRGPRAARAARQVSVRYVELADYLAIAAEITGLDTNTLIRVTKVDLAESALHAPAAGFGETEFYPDLIDKAAVLVMRLAKNHPLPDGNKRAAWVALRPVHRDQRLDMEYQTHGR
jgi:Fic/DOC family